ncbi:hypothetical protein HFD88_001921 [Aspergillus terreus]|nr:hypothetical protein HFD88_001921 [Aspergillus terreus]
MPEQRQRREEESGSGMKGALQGLAFFFIAQFVIGQFFNKNQQSGPGKTGSGIVPAFADRPPRAEITNYSPVPDAVAPIWPADSALDINIYVSPSVVNPTSKSSSNQLVLQEKNFTIGNYSDTREIETTIKVPKEAQVNGTLWAHFFVGLSGHQLDPTAKDYSSDNAIHFFRPLNQYLPKKKVKKLKNLLSSSEEAEEEEEDSIPDVSIASFYHPNFTVSVIPDSGVQKYRQIHPAVRKHMQLETSGARDASGQNGWYYPIVFLNTFWQLRSQMIELNSTVDTVPLRLTLNNLQNWKFSMMASVDDSAKQTARQAAFGQSTPGGGDGSEFEMVKEVLLNTNIYLLGTTGVVTILHMVFETLAFKNDISHWRKKKDVVGTSVRTILANVFMQTVIFLYLMDNSENTSWMILASQGFGILLEAWKITKTVDVRLRPPPANSFFSFLPYVIVFEDKHKLSETEAKTKEYDEIAFRWLYIFAVPLLGAYAAYSLIYNTHKSWYSYVIETLVGSVYAYGFLMMVPSLYINYRLKSVAHMPGKALTYKFLNTFIDDLFAFTVKMPWLHRLATLRDDVIFFIWLYQSYKYKVDYKRVNEFGQGGDSDVEEESSAPAEAKTEEHEGSSRASGKENNKSSTRKRKLPFLYPNFMRAIRSCEPTTYRSIRIPSNGSRHVPFHTSRRKSQEAYHRRYGPAAEANLPPPPRPKGDTSDKTPPSTPAAKDTGEASSKPSPPEPQSQAQDRESKDNAIETSSRDKTKETAESAEQAESKPSSDEPKEPTTTDDHNADEHSTSSSSTEEASEQRPDSHPHPLSGNPLEGVLHMPSPSSFLAPSSEVHNSTNGDGKPPHLTPAPYVHHFDTYSLVQDLSKGGFTEDQSVTIMKAVRRILQNNLDLAKQSLTSKSDVENESYLFKAACSELQSSLQTARNSEMQRQRASRTQLQHEADILSQRLNQELAGLKDDIKGMFNDHKMATREQQRSIDTSVQELNYKITVSLNSDGKSEIEGLRWILTRRAALAIATSAVMIILFLKYYSVRKTQDVVEKKKEPPVAEVTEKRRVQDAAPVVDAKVTPDVLIGESLG